MLLLLLPLTEGKFSVWEPMREEWRVKPKEAWANEKLWESPFWYY